MEFSIQETKYVKVMLFFVGMSQYQQLKLQISSCLTYLRQHGQHNQLKLLQTRVVKEKKFAFLARYTLLNRT